MSGFFNLGSLVLGVISWVIPIAAVHRYRKGRKPRNPFICSFMLCAVALVFQLLEIRHRVVIEDFSAIMDTINAICMGAVVLTVTTTVLNVAAAWAARCRPEGTP